MYYKDYKSPRINIIMIKKPLFSVIMPNYNNSFYIKKSINSIIKQTYENWELIIVDDGSTDNSIKAIKPFLKDSRIKLISYLKNRGVGYASKIAMKHVSGEIIGTLDSDDLLHEKAIETMVNAHIKYSDYGLIFSNRNLYDKNLKIIKKLPSLKENLPKNIPLIELLQKDNQNKKDSWLNYISFSFRTFKKSAYDKTKGFDEKLRGYIDWDIYFKLEKVAKIKAINKYHYYYIMHKKSGVCRKNPNREYNKAICFFNEYKRSKRKIKKISRKSIERMLLSASDTYIQRKEFNKARDLLIKAFILDITKIRNLFFCLKLYFLEKIKKRLLVKIVKNISF